MVSLALISPRPSSRTPPLARRTTLAFTSDSTLMVFLASTSLASMASCKRSRLISANSTRKMLLKPRFGSRRCSGIWPPSKPLMRTPERAVWPLPPRPACLPLPEPMPRPTRMRGLDEPGLSLTSLSFMGGDPYRPSTTRSRCATLAIMPRLAGVSATLDLRPILLRPRPLSVSRCEPGRPIALEVCSSIMFLSALIVLLSRIRGVGFDALAARLNRRHLEVASLGDRPRAVLAGQRVEGGAHHVIGIRRALALGDDIVHTERLEDGAHRAPGDNAGAS